MSYESEVEKKLKENQEIDGKLNISVLKYFWQASPLSGGGDTAIPKFLRNIKVLKNFTDNELRILSSYMHLRFFSSKETIFKQDDYGVGFYFIHTGQVEVFAKSIKSDGNQSNSNDSQLDAHQDPGLNFITTLEKYDHFGEMAILQDNAVRTAYAQAKESCSLLGIFKPDLNEMVNYHPVVGAKFLQSISIILADRLSSVSKEMKILKYKFYEEEGYEFKGRYQK